MSDALKERIQKLLALAERGVGGEAVNARAALEAVLRNNGLTLDDMMDEQREMCGFTWDGKTERRLLTQIIATVLGAEVNLFRSRSKRCQLLAQMTKHERVEVELLWNAHRKQLKNEMDLFYSAYLHKHRLFPKDGETKDNLTEEDQRRIKRITLLMLGMDDVSIRRQLCSSAAP